MVWAPVGAESHPTTALALLGSRYSRVPQLQAIWLGRWPMQDIQCCS